MTKCVIDLSENSYLLLTNKASLLSVTQLIFFAYINVLIEKFQNE